MLHAWSPCSQLVNVSYEGYLNLMNDFGQLRNDLKLPDGDLGKEISKKFNNDEEVTVSAIICYPVRNPFGSQIWENDLQNRFDNLFTVFPNR